ncbi:MAG: hypothetical protein ACI9KE_000082 [Polyangiales bacterium]|jgi:hypothetical protein
MHGIDRGLVLLLLLASVVGCGDDAVPDASEDAGSEDVDAQEADAQEVDVQDTGGPDARDSSGPPAPWRHEPVITVQSAEPCEDWVPVEPMPRGLPDDATPRLLWRYRPANDPRYSGPDAIFLSNVSEPVVSPDGTIWVHGPRAAHVTQLSRDGLMRRWFLAGGADENDPKILYSLGPLLPLPDGRVVASVAWVDESFPGVLTVMDPSGSFSPATPAVSGARLSGLDSNTKLAVGPGGMVYATGGNKLYATCRGERLMWTLTNELIEPGVGEGRFTYFRVEADGTVVLSGGMQRLYYVDPSSHQVEASQPVALERNEVVSLVGTTLTSSLMYVSDDRESDMVVVTRGAQVQLAGALSGSGSISPTGSVHYWSGQPLVLDPPYTGEPRAVPGDGPFDNEISWWFESGDWVRLGNGITRFNTAGEEVWNAPISMDGEDVGTGGVTPMMTMDETGVVFSSVVVGIASIELAAFQTDGLPPPMSVCVQEGCNAHRDRWVRPAE